MIFAGPAPALGGTTLSSGTDYTLSYAGTDPYGTVTAAGIGNFEGTLSACCSIVTTAAPGRGPDASPTGNGTAILLAVIACLACLSCILAGISRKVAIRC